MGDISRSAAYVRSQGQSRPHTCHWPGCSRQVPPAKMCCPPHWFALPEDLRARIWQAYVPGQEVTLSPSREYLLVANEAQRFMLACIERQLRERSAHPQTSLF